MHGHGVARRWAFLLCVATWPLHAAPVADEPEWPPLAAGEWRIVITKHTAGGVAKPRAETRQLCRMPGEWFARYPGAAAIGRAGCRFGATRLDARNFQLRHTCALLKGGVGVVPARVALQESPQGVTAFESRWQVEQPAGPKSYRETVQGTWLRGACLASPPASPAASGAHP